MAFPDTLLAAASTWFSNVLVDAARIQANITDNLNTLATRVTGIGQGFLGGGSSASTVTLSTTSAFASLGPVTFTLATQRRVRIYVSVEYDPATAVIATYQTIAGYNSGSSAVIGSFTQVGKPFSINFATVRPENGAAEGTALLAAGTYTAYASVKRVSGGTATDTAGPFQVDVYDVGSV